MTMLLLLLLAILDRSNSIDLPEKWLAHTRTTTAINGTAAGGIFVNNTEFTAEDVKGKKRVVKQIAAWEWSPEAWVQAGNSSLNITTITIEKCAGIFNCTQYTLFEINTAHYIEQQTKAPFSGSFAWAKHVQPAGNITYRNESVIQYVLKVGKTTSLELLIGPDGYPRRNTENATIPNRPPSPYSGSQVSQVQEFFSFEPDTFITPDPTVDLDLDSFLNPKTCTINGASSTVENISMYIFHPANEFDVAGQDLGDAQGDTYFTCVDLLTSKPGAIDHDYQWISSYEVEANTTFGEYQNCNGYNPPNCFGKNDFLVGHIGAQNQGPAPNDGQCTTNPLVGEWYSLPVGGKCSGSATPGGGTCSWLTRHVKTIDSKCLIKQHDFKGACAKDGRAPFAAATAVFKKAFASDDVSLGGCPALPYPGVSE